MSVASRSLDGMPTASQMNAGGVGAEELRLRL